VTAPKRYPTSAEMEVLSALKDYHFLTVEQIMLVTGRTSLRSCQHRLRELADAGFVLKHDRRSSNVLQPLRAAWSLTSKSKSYLEGAGTMVLPARHPRPYILDHTLAINEVLIKARILEQTTPGVELLEWQHDRNLRRWRPILSIVPDGFLHFAVTTSDGRHGYPILLEVDMGTVDRRRWQEKVRRYLQFFTGEFQTVFHTDAATVAIVVSHTEKRVAEIKRWIEWELTRLNAKASGEIFYITQLTDNLSAEDLFLSPRYEVAFEKGTDALLQTAHAGVVA
jgi:DNA-binding HxlR family transcriptional regulator